MGPVSGRVANAVTRLYSVGDEIADTDDACRVHHDFPELKLREIIEMDMAVRLMKVKDIFDEVVLKAGAIVDAAEHSLRERGCRAARACQVRAKLQETVADIGEHRLHPQFAAGDIPID